MADPLGVDRRTLLGTIAGAGTASFAGCAGLLGDAPSISVELESSMELPPLFDCNAWTGEPEDGRVSARLYRPADGRGLDSPADLVAEMDRIGIDLALVYHVTARTQDSKVGNDRLRQAISDYPRLLPTWVASPTIIDEYGSADALVDDMVDANIHALRIFPGELDYLLTDPALEPLFGALAAADKPLILDALSGVVQDGFTYGELRDVCAAYEGTGADDPELTVILTQLWPTMGTLSSMGAMVESVERVGNLYVDTARFQTFEGLRLFVDRVGVDRLIFGTHLPHSSAGAGLATIVLSSLTSDETRQVAGENLAGLLRGTSEDITAAGEATESHYKTVPYGIFDMHGHVRGNSGQDRYPDADGLVAVMDRVGIDFAVVSNLSGRQGNDIAAAAGRQYPDRLLPAALANPNWVDVGGELERSYDDLGTKAIKIHPYSHETPPDDPAYDPVWEFANDRQTLLVTHANCKGAERDAWIDRANEYTDLTLMLYHAGRGWDTADRFVAVADATSNVVLEITYSYNVDGIIEYLIEHAGTEAVFFGTDLGARAPESQIGWATYARIDDETRWRHMRENARRLLDDLDILPDVYTDE